MALTFFRRVRRRPRKRTSTAHYRAHKEPARTLIHERLLFWNERFQLSFGRVAIRDQRSRWGSCSKKRNLNFNYRLLFLPQELVDYVVVHELCHLIEFNHSPRFWSLVAQEIPDYKVRRKALQRTPLRSLRAPTLLQ